MSKSIINIFTFLPVELCDLIYQYSKPNYLSDISNNICKLQEVITCQDLDSAQEWWRYITFFCKEQKDVIYWLKRDIGHLSHFIPEEYQTYMYNKLIDLYECKRTQLSYRLFIEYCEFRNIKIQDPYSYCRRTKMLYHLWFNNIPIHPRINTKKLIQMCLSF